MNQCREVEMRKELARFEARRVEEEEKKKREELEKRFGALPGIKRLIADVGGDKRLVFSMLDRVQQFLIARNLPPSELLHQFDEVCHALQVSQPEDRRILRLVISILGGRRQ